ncbi:MAG: hypothetical protein KA144_02155 [Xanthomonadaceae bacterium]|nr:hypothetical protein [Xanthomonadaceae bacterium]
MRTPKIPAQRTPEPAPPPPTIDQAQVNADQADRLRRRRGRLATIFAGKSGGGSAPTAGTNTMTGQ